MRDNNMFVFMVRGWGRGIYRRRVKVMVVGLVCSLLAAGVLWGGAPGVAVAAPGGGSTRELGRTLASLRSEVDGLEKSLEEARQEGNTVRKSLEFQKGDLEVMLRKEQVRQDTLQKLKNRNLNRRREIESWAEELREPAIKVAREMELLVDRTIPFKADERRAALVEIRQGLESGQGDPVTSLSRLWQLMEDELRLTSDSGLHRQVVELEGRPHLVETVQIGMSLLYFKTGDDRYGWAVPTGSTVPSYQFRLARDKEHVKALRTLFDSFKMQIYKGFYQLPVPHQTIMGEDAGVRAGSRGGAVVPTAKAGSGSGEGHGEGGRG